MVVGELVETRDVVVIGGGPGGYNAAIRAAQLGLQVTIIEKKQLGGICLNSGCIPSKVFTHAAKEFASLATMETFGISTANTAFDHTKLQDYKNQTITRLRKGVQALLKANKIEIIEGEANFIAENRIGVENGHQFDMYEFNHAIIATGAMTVPPENITDDNPRVLLPHEIYRLQEMPEQLIVYGSDYISLEVAFSYKKLGSDVTFILDEKEDFAFDDAINRELKRIFKKEKIKVYRGYQVENVDPMEANVEVVIKKGENTETLVVTHVCITGKQQTAAKSLGSERLGVTTTPEGFIQTDKTMKTSVPTIFAIGDVTEGTPSAVKAIKQGKVAAETIAGVASEVDLTFLPTVVHSIPPIAAVGLTEQTATDMGYKVKASQFSLSGNSYATISNAKNGIVKLIKDADTDLLLGFHAIGSGAVELISTGVTALEMVAREEDLVFPLYPHPSLNEALMEAVENLSGKAVHIAP